ncbi:cell division control protein 6 homolog [Ostrea edulis]|uniref:cell division control protein 6 homolog n=1 Tax=Ostrea edulis TaxID=37623 RepID=UPI0024AEC1BD|nr:cell division control protein 6 homolog [Ostrea edulis]
MDTKHANVQRKLEFPVRKSTRSTRAKHQNRSKTESPRKRCSDDENNTASTLACSPTKRSKRLRETPTRSRLRSKLFPMQSTDNEVVLSSPTKLKSDKVLVSPVKQKAENNLASPVKSKTSDGRKVKSPFKENKNADKENTPVKVRMPGICSVKPLSSPVRKQILATEERPISQLKLHRPNGQVYHKAKQTFHTAKPDRLVGREKEVEDINKFVKKHVSNKTSASLYISGAPGTGKTASLYHILDTIKISYSCKSLYLNCMALKDSATVYGKLYTELTGKSPPSAKDRLRAVEKCLTASGPSIIMVLDEIDQLDSKNQEILYTIFEWPTLAKSRLVLIGIANALDLTDRILPRLQARPNCKPQLLNFPPYSREQIAAILQDRLQMLEKDGVSVVEPSAVQFCARKISAVAGDMRKALDVCRRAIEMVEQEVKAQQTLKLSTHDCPNSPTKMNPPMKKIGVMQISKVLSEVYGSSSASNSQDSIPLQQKLIVCTLLLMVKQGKLKEVTLGKLHDTYTKVCKKRQMAAIDYSEYQGVVSLLETRGITGIKKVKDGRMAKVTLKLDEKELEHTLQDKVLMSGILKDGLP